MLFLWIACVDYELGAQHDVIGGESLCATEEPEAYAVDSDEGCVADPIVGTFTPEVEWVWRENSVHPGYDDIMATPAIGQLNDDNADGAINNLDIPDIVFTTFEGGQYSSAGALVAISGDGTGLLWSVLEAGGVHPYGTGGVAIGDLDGDGQPEVCVAAVEQAVLCVNNLGEFVWAAGGEVYRTGTPNLADLDGDGSVEVVFGRQILNADGSLAGLGAYGTGGRSMSFAVDMDDDGQLEVVAGNAIYERDGSLVWTDGGSDGIPAVADFDGDGRWRRDTYRQRRHFDLG
jgi:hypothetical protein